MSPNERSEYSMTNTSPRRENVESMYTLFGDVLSRSLLAQNPEPERGAREKRESDQGGGWISGKQHTHSKKC